MTTPSPVAQLASAQLAAYNRADLDAFCACYSHDVRVLDERGRVTVEGMERFRAEYDTLFSRYRDVSASVTERIVLGRHAVDLERWERTCRQGGERTSGTVLVRYTERDGAIAIVTFLR